MPKKWKLGRFPPVAGRELEDHMRARGCLDEATLRWGGIAAQFLPSPTEENEYVHALEERREREKDRTHLLELTRTYLGLISPLYTDDEDTWQILLKLAPPIDFALNPAGLTPRQDCLEHVPCVDKSGHSREVDDLESRRDLRRLAAFADPLLHDGMDRSVIIGHAVLGGVYTPPTLNRDDRRLINMAESVMDLEKAKRRYRRNVEYKRLHEPMWWLCQEIAKLMPGTGG